MFVRILLLTLFGLFVPALTFAQTALSPQISKAESGDLQAQLSVAQAYQYGLGAEKDIQEATHWYERAADQGSPLAMYELGTLVYSGVAPDDLSDTAKDAAAASVAWFEKAARLGFPQAQSSLGLLYGFGDRVETDRTKGRMWIAVAELNGFTSSGTMVRMLDDRLSDEDIADAHVRAAVCVDSGYEHCE